MTSFAIAVLAMMQAEPSAAVTKSVPGGPPPVVRSLPPLIWTIPTAPPPSGQELNILLPAEAVMKAADAAPAGVAGDFGFRIEAVGTDRSTWLFLNSEADYRDQRNLTLAVAPTVQATLRQRYGADLQAALKGRQILVRGIARRVRIDFTINGQPSGKFYYQTHVRVTDPRQIVTIN